MRRSMYRPYYDDQLLGVIDMVTGLMVDDDVYLMVDQLPNIGNRDHYNGTVVFNSYKILKGNDAHVKALAHLVQEIIEDIYPNLKDETLVLRIKNLRASLSVKLLPPEQMTREELRRRIRAAHTPALT